MMDPQPTPDQIYAAIVERLSQVIDPETGVDVMRMRLIEELRVDENGFVSYKFRPSSPLCPIAVPLSVEIQEAVSEVPNVTGQDLEVVGYLQTEALNAMLKEFMAEKMKRHDA